MVIARPDVNLFHEVAKLPSEVVAIILGYLPNCMLPELLYFSPIKKIVASTILSNVHITEIFEKHEGSDVPGVGYSECDCNMFRITLENLKKGIDKWNIYPKTIKTEFTDLFEIGWDVFSKLLTNALSIYGFFVGTSNYPPEELFELLMDSNVKFESLHLMYFLTPVKLPPVATSVTLHQIKLDTYVIPGVKQLILSTKSINQERTNFTFSPDLEDLRIEAGLKMYVNLPPNLQELYISSTKTVNFRSEEMLKLKHLELQLPTIQSFEETGIRAPNLEKLVLSTCEELDCFDNLKQFQHLKHLVLNNCTYPTNLLKQKSFPMLESFQYSGTYFPNLDKMDIVTLTFPSTLKMLIVANHGFLHVFLDTLLLPATLTYLKLVNVVYNDDDGYFHLGENLQYVHIESFKLAFDRNFRIPHKVEFFLVEAFDLYFDSLDFMYHLPNSLIYLTLLAHEGGEMHLTNQRIKWPSMVDSIVLDGFNIDYRTLISLNFNESRLETIRICGGNIKKLDVDLFPVSVKDLALMDMGIQELPASFEKLENLHRLCLAKNRLKKVNSVKLPISSLRVLVLRKCDLRLISPFLVSMVEEENRDAKLKVEATGNSNINVIDVRKLLKAIKGLSLDINCVDEALNRISDNSTRFSCSSRLPDPYSEESGFSETEEVVVSDYDSDGLYNGSVFSPDEDDSDDDDDDDDDEDNDDDDDDEDHKRRRIC